MNHPYTYAATLAASEKVNWRIEDVFGDEDALDFSLPFLPEALARTEEASFLSPDERRTLNQLRGHNYLYLFGLVEEFILPFVLDHARPHLDDDDYRVRALLRFATEEAKHIHLFKKFRSAFQAGFGYECDVIGPPREIARAVLAHSPLAVALTILHIEWMTQKHFQESVAVDEGMDPLFKSLLRHHWMEEAQHAKLDTLMVEALADGMGEEEIARAIDEYLEIGGMLDAGLRQQIVFDLDAFERATGRRLTDEEKETLLQQQHQSMRATFLGSGMTHPRFLDTIAQLRPEARARLEEIAKVFA